MFTAFSDYFEQYHPKSTLNYEMFTDIFSDVINNTRKCYSKLEKDGSVDMYEAFVAMTVFSSGDFDIKLKGLFRSFDTDDGGTIDKQELL